ncbi:MAG TPA: metal ABC transporter permease [Pirellulales bacterium]|jgi:ABC-type Mn2+/Zn2+ transport system permease subunit|nr:metal ABC transporter permease [Pirellulales bacterium]
MIGAFDFAAVDWGQAFWTIAAAALSSVSCALLGCYLVLRRMSLLGDAISHAILPGIAAAFWFGGTTAALPMFLGAVAVGLLTAALTETLHRAGNVPEDAAMGVVFTSLFALGVVMIARLSAGRVDLDPDCVLYGRIEHVLLETVPVLGHDVPSALFPLGATLLATAIFIGLCWKELKIASFDPALATAMGLSAGIVHYLLMGMVAVASVAAFDSVGSVIVVAMLIVPAAAAHLLADRLGPMLAWAAAIAFLSAVLGYLGAVWLNTVVAGMMAVAVGVQFALAVLLAPRHGLVSRAWHRLDLAMRIVSEDIIARLYRAEEGPSARQPVPQPAGGGFMTWLGLRRLLRRGDVKTAPGNSLRLTDQGRLAAQSLVRAHRLWEAYLGENFDLPLDHLHEPAERVEHYIGPKLQERLASELARPDVDPHGKEIPPS